MGCETGVVLKCKALSRFSALHWQDEYALLCNQIFGNTVSANTVGNLRWKMRNMGILMHPNYNPFTDMEFSSSLKMHKEEQYGASAMDKLQMTELDE